MVMMRRWGRALAAQIMMLGRVGMPEKLMEGRSPKSLTNAAQSTVLLAGSSDPDGAQRNMHGGHHQPIRGRLLKNIGHEGELPLAETALVSAIVAGSLAPAPR